MANASVAFVTARTLLNDDAGTLWTDAVLLPKLQEAHRELQVELQAAGIPVIKAVTAVLSVPANTTLLSSVSGFPSDLVEPQWLKEKYPGQPDNDFIDTSECDIIPDLKRTNRLRYWAWLGEQLISLGATVATEVKLRYLRGLAVPTSASSSIGFIYGENFLGHRTAALAASSTGNDSAYAEWSAEANSKVEKIIRMNIKGQQNLPARRRGYHRGRFNSLSIRGY